MTFELLSLVVSYVDTHNVFVKRSFDCTIINIFAQFDNKVDMPMVS